VSSILIKGGFVIDPSNNFSRLADILVENGKIRRIGRIRQKTDYVIDAKEKIVCPGFIDLHAHLREPGREDEETILTGLSSGVVGGFTSICCMPNTDPPIDNSAVVEFIKAKARETGLGAIFPIGAISKGLKGKELSEIGSLVEAGCVAVSDDGRPIMDSGLMRRGLEYIKIFDIPIVSHCEDLNLSADGVMNEGYQSTILGLRGIPNEAEEVMISRDLILASLTGSRLHIAHVSTRKGVELIREAKRRGVKVTCEVTPHHLALTDEAVSGYDPNTKVNPPLRTRDDIEALVEGLKDGTIDVIATDHAPHTEAEKDLGYDLAPFGVIGLETAASVVITELWERKGLPIELIISKLTSNPAKVFGIRKGTLSPGEDADIVVIDIKRSWVVEKSKFRSKSQNSPFQGFELKGVIEKVIVNGRLVFSNGELLRS
jgi:dihydroorotase